MKIRAVLLQFPPDPSIMNPCNGECLTPRTYGEAWAGNDLDSLPISRSFRHA